MANVSTTKMSSKGQVVIPENIRKELNLKAGAQFVVVGEKDVERLRLTIVTTTPSAPPICHRTGAHQSQHQ